MCNVFFRFNTFLNWIRMEITVHVPKKRGENLPNTLTDSLPAPPLQSRRQTESIMNPISRLLCYPLWLPLLLCVVVVVVAVKHASLYVAGVTGNGQRAACVWRRARWAQANVELVAVSWRGCQPFLAKHFRWIPAIFCLHFVNPKTQNRKTKNPMPKPTPNGSQAGLNSKLKGIRFSLW